MEKTGKNENSESDRAGDRSKAELLQANRLETLGRLTVGVAHDLNSLLTVILTCCDALTKRLPAEDEVQDSLKGVEEACRRAAGLTRQLLTFGRPVESRKSSFDLNELLADAEGMLRRLLPRDIELSVRLASEPVFVAADRVQIQQLLLNLALNSRDAMPEGGRLSIELQPLPDADPADQGRTGAEPARFFQLTVRDTGTGIPTDIQEKIFEPFVTTKSATGGNGVGLSTVAEIVKRHGGSIGVESEPGEGTTFAVRLPRARPARVREQPKQPCEPEPCGGETVLVLENDSRLCETLQRILRGAGYRVLVAKDVETAARIVTQHPAVIHLLLADSDIAAARAPEFVAAMEASQPQIRVVYTSNSGDEALVKEHRVKPGTPTMLKPFSSSELLAVVRKVLAESVSQKLALVVDGDPIWREAASRPLQERGYTVITAQDEREASGWLKKKEFDLCVVEVAGSASPDTDFVRTIREKCPPAVSVLATGYFHGDLLEAARSSGADAVMQKPYSRDDLLIVLDTHLGRPSGRAAAGRRAWASELGTAFN